MSDDPNIHYRAKCFAKTRRDQDGAERHAAYLRRKDGGSKAYAYQCHVCGYWHVSCNIAADSFKRRNARLAPKQRHEQVVERWERRLEDD